MKNIKPFILLFIAAISIVPSYAQGLKSFKLKNGLTVLIWEDNTQSDVYGLVGVRAGAVNDPEQYTGLAHYLEHVLFKGTDKIGALNWAEEEPIYNRIIAKYDEMAEATDPAIKEAINKEINELTIQAGKISMPNEFPNLIESMGGTGLNAGTSYDYTVYHNSFPPYQINKWLEIYSQRLINPVFRAFQPELETVYEEFNRSQDNPSRVAQDFMLDKAFEGHPYSRSVLGLPEHLKNPRLSALIKFYNEWYTPENMVLVLVGNIDTQKISGRIAATFGRLKARPVPERQNYPELDIKGRKQYTAKISPQPMVRLIYQGVPSGHPDEKALTLALSLLSNSNSTGVLDKLAIDGEIMAGASAPLFFREQGRCIVLAVPTYDENQRRYESNKVVEKKLLKAIETVANGKFEDWVVEALKISNCRQYDLALESNEERARMLSEAFINEEDLSAVLNYKEEIMAITVDDIKRVAKQYLSDNYLALYLEKGKEGKKDKMKKPGFKPLEKPDGQQSLYAQQFKSLPIGTVEEEFMDFNDVQVKQLNDRSKMFYSKNTENEVFTLVIKYGAGTHEYPKLDIAAELMNNAGIMGAYEPQELKQEFSRLGVVNRVFADKDYLYIIMNGYEANLQEACQLLSRQILMPKLDEKQLRNSRGSILGERQQRKENVQTLGRALNQYIVYQDKSSYIDELTDKQVLDLKISELTGDINRAANYEAEIYYTGTLDFDNIYDILSNNLPLVANEKPSKSPLPTELAPVTENTVYFLPNTDAEQAQLHFYFPMMNYDKENDVIVDAFNQYFAGGFNGLVTIEIREKRSMAYQSHAGIVSPPLPEHPNRFLGFIGTQNDKAIEALTIFKGLIDDMPEIPERINNIKSYLRQEALTSKPNPREKAQTFEYYKRKGYTQDPAAENLAKIDALTFEDIVKFYNENIKGKPVAIGIMGNPKEINMEELKKFGKVVRLNEKKLFNPKDVLF